MSAIPVREALKTLIGEGLADHRPHGGYNVSLLSVEELHEIYFVRGVLEEAALARAVDKATDDDLARARRYHEQLLTATKFRDRKSFHDVSRKFHRQPARCARCRACSTCSNRRGISPNRSR